MAPTKEEIDRRILDMKDRKAQAKKYFDAKVTYMEDQVRDLNRKILTMKHVQKTKLEAIDRAIETSEQQKKYLERKVG